MDKIRDVLIVGLVIALLYFQLRGPKVVIVETPVEQQIDETVWVKKTEILTKENLLKEIEEENKKLKNDITKKDGVIIAYTKLEATLSNKLDSLSSVKHPHKIDTLLTSNHYFADSTFVVKSDIEIKNSIIKNDIQFKQIKPIKITTVTTLVKNRPEVYIKSELFNIKQVSKSEYREEKKYTWELITAALLGGLIIGTSL